MAKPLSKPSKRSERIPVDIHSYLLAYERGWSLTDIGKATGHSRNTVSRALGLLITPNTEYVHKSANKERKLYLKVQAEKRAEKLGIATTKAQLKRAKRQSILGLRARMGNASEGNKIHRQIQREGSP